MLDQNTGNIKKKSEDSTLMPVSRGIVQKAFQLSGSDALNMILDQENALQVVWNMTRVDFFWLVKKIGEDDSLPLLKLASSEQWQHIMDMELWQKDRFDTDHATEWLCRLYKVDPARLVKWLFSEGGNLTAHLYFFNKIQVEQQDEDNSKTFSNDFFTLDGIYYIRIIDKEHEQEIEQVLKTMMANDHLHFQALLLGMTGVIPSEIEEEMYRMQTVRLAEDGYLPFYEALGVYAYQKIDKLKPDRSEYKLYLPDGEDSTLVPVTPFLHARSSNLLSMSLSGISDPLLMDRIQMEFAGLCNQIFSADNIRFDDQQVLVRTCRKAAGYLNAGLEKLSGGDVSLAVQYIKNNPLISLFRAGFGLALELRWEADRWLENAWFLSQDLSYNFWGEEWSGILKGIIQDRPLYYSALKEEDEYREFETLSEIENYKTALSCMIVLDRLLKALTSNRALDLERADDPFFSFYTMLFGFWARLLLKLEPGFKPLDLTNVREFFKRARSADEKAPPYSMPGFKEVFIRDLSSYLPGSEEVDADSLEEALSIVWQEFADEYSEVAVSDLDPRYEKFFLIA